MKRSRRDTESDIWSYEWLIVVYGGSVVGPALIIQAIEAPSTKLLVVGIGLSISILVAFVEGIAALQKHEYSRFFMYLGIPVLLSLLINLLIVLRV